MTDNADFKEALLKVAGELRDVAQELREETDSFTKQASNEEPFSMGSVGRPNPAADPLYEFCMS